MALLATAACAAAFGGLRPPRTNAKLAGVLPAGTLSHFCVLMGWDRLDEYTSNYIAMLGSESRVPGWGGLGGGLDSNGTYIVDGVPQKLKGHCNATWVQLNNDTKLEILAGEPSQPSWWRDVYHKTGHEVHHMGYNLPAGVEAWSVVTAFEAAGLGSAVQWGRFGKINTGDGSGCYIFMDSQDSLGVTTEIVGSGNGECDTLPAQPGPAIALPEDAGRD